MHDLWFTGLCSGHVMRGRYSRDAGASGKAIRRKLLLYPPAPGGSDAKAVLKHSFGMERKKKQPACTCEAKVHLDR
jgi:hypothetical protein